MLTRVGVKDIKNLSEIFYLQYRLKKITEEVKIKLAYEASSEWQCS